MSHLTDGELWCIINALRTAAEQYKQDGERMTALGHPHSARNFDDQRKNAVAMADRFEAASSVEVVS